jgi:hypothetical protein
MSIKNFTEFNLPKNAYTAFEADTLKDLIIARLNENEVFRDQNFEGSNINAFVDIVAYMYHVLLFYLNTTSSESNFTTATLYENVNKLVTLLGYKPLGNQTSLLTLSLSADSNIPPTSYILPRFSFINANGINYTTVNDISFEKTTSGTEALYIDNNILMQGSIIESPTFTGTGENFETIILVNTLDDNSTGFIADNSFTLFVQSNDDGKWYEWKETSSLFLEQPDTKRYEKRLNENGNYEFKFGNDIAGKALRLGESVKIFYIQSDGNVGEIGASVISSYRFNLYNSPAFKSIAQYVYADQTNLVTPANLPYLYPNNANNSSPVADAETVDQIKQNAPKLFLSQDRLVTGNDYQAYIAKNYNNIIKSVSILSNEDFTSKYLAYFYSIGLNRPNEDCRVLFNQVRFAPSTNFNNVYIFSVPKISPILNDRTPNYLNPSQKQIVINECNLKKDITHTVVCMDPVYKAFSFGLQITGEQESISLSDNTYLIVKRDINVKTNSSALKDQIVTIYRNYFDSIKLGDVVNLNKLTDDILNIEGVTNILTRRTDTGYEAQKINYVVWNPLYEQDDVIFTSQNYKLQNFMYAYFYDISNLGNKIIIENE